MSKTLSNYISEVQPIIRDRTGNFVADADVKASLNRGIRYLQNETGVSASKNRYELDIFPNVYEYPLPSDFLDPITLQERGEPVNFARKGADEFWLRLDQEDRMFAIDNILGTQFLLCNYSSAGESAVLHSCDDHDANGTWTADTTNTDATNVTTDTINEKKGAGCVNFDLDVSQSGNDYAAIYNSDMTAVDIEEMEDAGTVFLYLYIPDSTYTSSVTVRWGSSSSAYWSNSATTQYNGQAFRDGWNRIGVAWATASETGSPDSSAVDYLYVQVTYSSSQADDTDYLIDDIRCETPQKLELHYYSTYMVSTSGGTKQATFSSDDDYVLLNDIDADILYYWALQDAHLIKEQFTELSLAREQFADYMRMYKKRHISERTRPTRRYY